MKNISFFFKESGAGLIDGKQIGEYLNAKLNPESGYEDDICIYVKQQPPEIFPKNSYVNIVDGDGLVPWIESHSEIGIITTSLTGYKYLSYKLKRDDIVFIPEHHCNIEKLSRKREFVNVVGVIGNRKGFDIDLDIAAEMFGNKEMEFVFKGDYKSREDVVDFYKGIDIQLCWRPNVTGTHAQLHNPLKLANAGSFGIPTIAFPEDNFVAEFDSYFLPIRDKSEIVTSALRMKFSPSLYTYYSKYVKKHSESYHIANVAKKYEVLKERS